MLIFSIVQKILPILFPIPGFTPGHYFTRFINLTFPFGTIHPRLHSCHRDQNITGSSVLHPIVAVRPTGTFMDKENQVHYDKESQVTSIFLYHISNYQKHFLVVDGKKARLSH